MREITLEELLEAGCHFGHQVTRQNPKARDFIFEARDNIHIIDLVKTKEELEIAAAFIKEVAAKGGTMIVIGTKRQAKPIVEAEAKRLKDEGIEGVFTITNRWIGGTLTNFPEVAKNYRKLKDLKRRLEDPEEKSRFTKKEVGKWAKEKIKLESFYGGTQDLLKTPDVLFIVDTHLENIAVLEAVKTGIPTVGFVDTNADPTVIDYAIPANDDAVGSIQLITSYILDAWKEGKKEKVTSDKKQETKAAAAEEKEKAPVTEKKATEPKEKKVKAKKTEEKEAVKTSEEKIEETRSVPSGQAKKTTKPKKKKEVVTPVTPVE